MKDPGLALFIRFAWPVERMLIVRKEKLANIPAQPVLLRCACQNQNRNLGRNRNPVKRMLIVRQDNFALSPFHGSLENACQSQNHPSQVTYLDYAFVIYSYYSTVGIYNTCIFLFIAVEAVCEDHIPDTVTCPTNPLNGKPLSCDDIDMGLSEFGIPKSTICKNPISKIIQLGDNPIGCIGGGNVEDYCRKTCSNCGINILLSLRQIKKLY